MYNCTNNTVHFLATVHSQVFKTIILKTHCFAEGLLNDKYHMDNKKSSSTLLDWIMKSEFLLKFILKKVLRQFSFN